MEVCCFNDAKGSTLAYGQQPSYAFSIKAMAPRTGIQEQWSHHGRWRPPKALGNNLSDDPMFFFFNPRNDTANYTVTLPDLPPDAKVHKTYSIYWERAIIWTVDYDATQEQVGDGMEGNPPKGLLEQLDHPPRVMNMSGFQVQSSASSDVGESDDDHEYRDEWAPLKFNHRDRDRLSYAGRRQPHSRLCVRRLDQEWPQKLLPDTCSAEDMSDDPWHGGLIGELPLLIGLMALAIPKEELIPGLCASIGRPWTAPHFERAAGCKSSAYTAKDILIVN